VAGYIVVLAYMLIAMAMAGLGLNVEFKTFRKLGSKAFVAGLIAISLAVWSLYNLIIYGSAGMPFVLFVLGQFVYFFVNYWPKW
ncbi:hypothetical protein, partial [Bacillus cereus]